jgi:hypothetical protein
MTAYNGAGIENSVTQWPKTKKPAKEDLPATQPVNGCIAAIAKSPFQTREAITFPF